MKGVIGTEGEGFRHSIDFNREGKAVGLPASDGVCHIKFHRSHQVLAVTQVLSIKPIIRPAMHCLEAKEDAFAGPG